ncbi:hypothetical protein BJX62DRAFT_146551 [Aspergillus germanicus]
MFRANERWSKTDRGFEGAEDAPVIGGQWGHSTFDQTASNEIKRSLHRVGTNARFAMFSILDPPLSDHRLDLVWRRKSRVCTKTSACIGKLGTMKVMKTEEAGLIVNIIGETTLSLSFMILPIHLAD